MVESDKKVYMQLQNIQQQTAEHVEVYYEHLLKLANCLQVKVVNVFLTTIFKACLLPYLRLATTKMKINTLIEHKEAIIICEESGPISLSYNVLLTTLEVNVVVKLVVFIIIVKSTLTYINCVKTSHSMETCHNKKEEVLVVLITIVKSIELVGGTKTQLAKSRKSTCMLSLYNLFQCRT